MGKEGLCFSNPFVMYLCHSHLPHWFLRELLPTSHLMAQVIHSAVPSSPDESVFGHGQSRCVLTLLAEMKEGNPSNES